MRTKRSLVFAKLKYNNNNNNNNDDDDDDDDCYCYCCCCCCCCCCYYYYYYYYYYVFEPIAVDTVGARYHIDDLGRTVSLNSGEARETSYLYQRISVLVHNSLPAADGTD